MRRIGRVNPTEMNQYPLVIDYDFVNLRPRGGSACIDLFSSGRLCSVVDSVGASGVIYVQKNDIVPDSGFFLMDFAQMTKRHDLLLETLKDMNITELYLEDSKKYPLSGIFAKDSAFDLTLVSFAK